MTSQLSLDEALAAEHVYVARKAKATSREAALRALPGTATRRYQVLATIAGSPTGMTDDEIITSQRMPHQSVGPRRLELVEGGWIEDSGQRRKTRTGADAIVWVLSEAGQARWGQR